MKKRFLSITVAAVMTAALLVGCAGNKEASSEPAATETAGEAVAEEAAPEAEAGSAGAASDEGGAAQEAPEGAAAETAEEAAAEPEVKDAAYDPASFDPNDVYTPEEHQVSTVYEGCDTFTQMLDKAENKGKGYTNVKIGDQDVLLMVDQTYEYEPGKNAAIDAEIFYYADEGPAYMAYVQAGGTAYPLAVKDGLLYVGGNHFMIKYTIRGDKLEVAEEVYVNYNSEGEASYYYRTGDSSFADHDAAEAEEAFNRMFGELDEESILFFDIIGGA